VLKTGLDERDDSVLTTLSTFAPTVVIIARSDDPGGGLAAFVEHHAGAERLDGTATHTMYLLPRSRPGKEVEGPLAIRSALFRTGNSGNSGPFDLAAVTDGDPETAWVTPKPQRGGEEVVIELTATGSVSGVSLSTGPPLEGYPRSLAVATSIDGQNWEAAWSGGMAGPALEGILRDPRNVESRVAFGPRTARFMRLRQLGAHPDYPWVIAELKVYASLTGG